MMPVYKNERLKGLRGIGELSDTERNEYMQSVYDLNPDKKDRLDNLKVSDWDRLYRDSQFKNTLAGYLEETNTTINDYTPEQRDKIYTDYVVNNAIDDQFGLYPEELNKIRNSGLSTNGLIELLESDYVPTAILNGYYDEKNKKLHNDYQLAAGMEESKRYIKKHNDDPLQLLGYASYGSNWLFNIIGNILVEPLEAGNEASRQKAIDKNEAILNNIADKDLKNRLEKYSSTGYPKQIQDNVWEVYNNAQSSGEKGIEVLKTWYDNLVGEDSYTDEQGRHIYKNSDGDWVYTNIEGKEEYAPEAIQMSDIEIEQYKELSKEGKVNPDEEPWQDENGNWYRKIRRFEDKGNGAYHIFKDRKQFDENHVSPDQMVQWITDYLTLEAFEGRSTALQKSSLDSQKHISDNQFKLVTDVSQIYSRIIGGLVNTTYVPIREKNIRDEYGEEGLANVLAGLNPDGTPVERYDRTNPYYWSMVETSGSTATGTVNDYIKYGYSPYQSIYDPTESEWGVRRTISDAMPMVGYSIEQMALAAATDGLSRVASGAVRGIGRGVANTVANRSTNAIMRNAAAANYKFANKLGKGIIESQRFTVPVINSLGIAQGYGSEAFKNVYEQGMDQINELKRADALEYVQSYLGTDEYKQAVENEFNRIYQGYNEAQRKEYKGITNEDGSWELVNPEVYARRQAELKVRNDLLQAYMNNPEIQKSHNGQSYADMERKLKEDAIMAYKTDYFIEAASQSVNFAMFKTFLMTPSQRMLYNNKPTKIGFEKGGKKAWADMSKKEKWILTGKGVGKTAFGGTLSNYNDEIRRDWSQAFGYHDFNDYMGYITNPDNYVDQEEFHRSFWEGIRYANKVAGETALKESSFRAGIVGGLGSIIGFGPNIGGIMSMTGSKNRRVTRQQLQDNLKAIQEGHPEKVKTGWNTDSKGNRLDVLEMVGNFVTNPLFQSYQDAGARMRMTEELVNSYNKFIEEHEGTITNMTNLLETAVRAYNMSINGRGHYLNEQDDGEGSAKKMPISLTGAVIDNDALAAFEIIRRISEYGEDKNFMGSDYLRRAYNNMQEILNGNRISEALIEEFLEDADNKKDTFGMSDAEKRMYAENALRDRIKDMKKVADAYNKARTNLNQSPFYTENDNSALNQVLYMSVMQDRWNDRLSKLNEELGNGNNHSAYYYGNKENYEQIREAQIETVNSLKQGIAQVAKEKLKAKDRQDKVIKGLHISMLTRQLEAEQRKLDQINADNVWNAGLDGEAKAPVLSTEEILNLNTSERAYMLDESNYNKFSAEQREVIDYLKTLMVDETGTNQATLDKINDARTLSERVQLNQMSLDQALTFPNSFITLTANTKRAYKANLINAYFNKLIRDEYTKLNLAQTTQEKMRVLKDSFLSRELLNEVIDMVPESTYNAEKIVFDGILREKQLEEDAMGLLDDYEATANVKEGIRIALEDAWQNSMSTSDAMGQIELMYAQASENPETLYNINDFEGNIVEQFTGAELATHLNNILSGLEKLDYMRNSAVVYNWREEQRQIRMEEERMQEAARIEAEKQKAEMEARLARIRQNEENERKAKTISEQKYADSREKFIEPKTKEEYIKAKGQAKILSDKYLAEILNGKSLRPLKTAIKNEKVNVTDIIETIQKYRNAEKLYGYLWNKSNNRTISAIENYLHELGHDWSSIEGKAIDETTSKDIIVNDVRHDDNVFKGISIAENSTPYIYKDGVLISKPRTDLVIGTQEITDEAVAPQKEWRKVRVDYRKFEKQLVEVPYKPYIKQKFQIVKKASSKDRLLDKFDKLYLSDATNENIILTSIARGQKFKWSGNDGIGTLLNKDEAKKYKTLIDEDNGLTVDDFINALINDVERLAFYTDTYELQGELRNALQDVLSHNYTVNDVLSSIQTQIDAHISEEERLEQEAKELAIREQQDKIAQEYGYPDMNSMKNDIEIIADVLQKEAEEKYYEEEAAEMSEEFASILDIEEKKSMEEEAAKHQEELENEIQEWKEGISDIYYNTEIEENYGTEETNTQPTGKESEGTEGTESESSEVLQGEKSANREGLEGTQPLQADSESPTVNGEPQVRPRGTTAVIEPTKLDSEKSVNEFVADEVKDNPEGMDIQTFKTSDFPIRIDERSTEKKDRLLGNAIRLFDLKWLDEEGTFGPLSDTSNARRNLWNFLSEHKIRLQDIIDFELGKIITEHPNIPIRFMKQKGSNNIYNVIEFTDDIAAIHNEDFGGVIESGGKKWLMVGILGYTMKNNWSTADQAALSDAQSSNFRIIREAIDSAMTEAKEEFFVHPTIYTKVLEQSNGFITNRESETSRPKSEEKAQQETKVEQHSIKELLSKKATNPQGLQFETLKFGIQKDDTFVVYNLEDGLFYPIKETDKNGSSYVLIPAANGNYVPMYIQPTYYKLLKNGRLKESIDNIFLRLSDPMLTSSVASARIVQRDLEKYIAFGNNEKGVRLAIHDNGSVQILVDGISIAETTLGNIDAKFLNTLKNQNLRINVDRGVFTDKSKFDMYSDAGALNVTSQMLGLRGSVYTVSPINNSGTPAVTVRVKSGVLRDNERQLPVKDRNTRRVAGYAYYGNIEYHRLANTPDIWREKDGTEVTDQELLDKLKYAEFIGQHKGFPNFAFINLKNKKLTQYYIYDEASKTGLRYDVTSDTFEIMSEQQYGRMIEAIKDAEQKKAAELARKEKESKRAEGIAWEDNPVPVSTENKEEKPIEAPKTQQPTIQTPTKEARNLQGSQNNSTFALEDILVGKAGKEAKTAMVEAIKEYANRKGIAKASIANIKKSFVENDIVLEPKNIQDWLYNINNCK